MDTVSHFVEFPALGWHIDLSDTIVNFSLFGHDWSIRWYGALIALGFLLAVIYGFRRAPKFGIDRDRLFDIVLVCTIVAFLGARLYYVLFSSSRDAYFANPLSILYLWEGGLAIYGGIIAGFLTTFFFCRAKKLSFPAMLDVISFGLLIGQILGRWGNFFNREAFGAETDIFCRMGLTAPDGSTIYVHPTFLYESLWNLAGLIFLILFSRKGKRRYDGQLILIYFFRYGLGRFWIEGLRTDSLYIGSTGIRVSQLLSAVLVLVAGTILFLNRKEDTLHEITQEIGDKQHGT